MKLLGGSSGLYSNPGNINEYAIKLTQFYNSANYTIQDTYESSIENPGYGGDCICTHAETVNVNQGSSSSNQVVIDVTGESAGIVKRVAIQTGVGGGGGGGSVAPPVPGNAISTINTLCKRLSVSGSTATEVLPSGTLPGDVPLNPSATTGDFSDPCNPLI